MTATPGAQPNFKTAKSSPRASEGKTPGLQAPRAPQAPTLKTSICTCAASQPSPLLPPGARRGQGSAPRPAAALHPGTGRSLRVPPVPPGGLRARRPARKPQPRPPPDRTSASCSRWSRPPAPPRSSAGPPVPTWPCQRGGATSAENKERPRRRCGSVADVSGRRTQEQSVRGAQKVPEIPAPAPACPARPAAERPGRATGPEPRGGGAGEGRGRRARRRAPRGRPEPDWAGEPGGVARAPLPALERGTAPGEVRPGSGPWAERGGGHSAGIAGRRPGRLAWTRDVPLEFCGSPEVARSSSHCASVSRVESQPLVPAWPRQFPRPYTRCRVGDPRSHLRAGPSPLGQVGRLRHRGRRVQDAIMTSEACMGA